MSTRPLYQVCTYANHSQAPSLSSARSPRRPRTDHAPKQQRRTSPLQSHPPSAACAAMLLDAALIAAGAVAVAAPSAVVAACAAAVEALALHRLDPAPHRPRCPPPSLPHGTRPQLSLELGTRSLRLRLRPRPRPKPPPAHGARSQTRPPSLRIRRRTRSPALSQRLFTTLRRP